MCVTWRLYPLWPHSIAHTSRHHGGVPPYALQIFLRLRQTQLARPFFSYSYKPRYPQPLSSHVHTKPPGPRSGGSRFLLLATRHFRLPLCFHILTNCFSRNSLVLITIRIAPGCGGIRYPLPTSWLAARLPRALLAKAHSYQIMGAAEAGEGRGCPSGSRSPGLFRSELTRRKRRG